MPNQLTALGLEVKTAPELLAEFTTAFETIYGSDINLDSDSPDAQMINIFITAITDNLDLLVQIYNSFDPENAVGVVLDQRVSYNGIERQAGTFSTTDITVVTSRALTMYGLDQDVEPVYTVSDNDGNEWQLLVTYSAAGLGTYVLSFQAVENGQQLTSLNTITTPVTIVLGVDSVNNPTVQTLIGENEETDFDLKIRRRQSVSLSSQGFLTSLIASLLDVTGVTATSVYENNTSAADADGIPAHSIWAIVSGTYDASAVANAIYQKRNAGAGMKGDIDFTITQVDGSPFVVSWDDVVTVPVFIKFDVASINGTAVVDYDAIRTGIPVNYIPSVYETLNINKLSTVTLALDNNALISNSGFSETLGGAYTTLLTPSTKDRQYVITDANVILLPILINPPSQTVNSLAVITFSAKGGYGVYVWSLLVDNSGASIDSGTGIYTAGAGTGVDTIRVTDGDSNTTDILITVV
jgi:hypothetical protein